MVLKDFLYKCDDNSLSIRVCDLYDKLLYSGMLYLIFHIDKEHSAVDQNNLVANFSVDDRDTILNAEITGWNLENDSTIAIKVNQEI